MSLIDAFPLAALLFDSRQHILAANRSLCDLLGHDADTLIAAPLERILEPRALARIAPWLDQARARLDLDTALFTAEHQQRDVRLCLSRASEDQVLLTVLEARQRQTEATGALSETERRLLQSAAVYANTSEGVVITDAAGVIVAVNAAFTRMSGYSEPEALGQTPALLNSGLHASGFFISMWRQLIRKGCWKGEIWNRRKDGEVHLQRLRIQQVLDAQGRLLNYVGVLSERSSVLNASSGADYLTHYDPLTKLPNRLLFTSRLEHAVDLRRRKRTPLAVFLLDIDRFSYINQTLGHQLGDALLQQVARRVRGDIRPTDTLARFGADRFALLFEDLHRIQDAESIARRLQALLHRALALNNHELFITVSVGIAFDPGRGDQNQVLLNHAESALSQAKQAARGALCIHAAHNTPRMSNDHQRLLALLRDGERQDELQLYYQPGVDLGSDHWSGAEVMVRWNQELFGPVDPERFLPLGNHRDFRAELDQWMLERACAQMRDWLDQGSPLRSLSISVDEALIERTDLVQLAERLLNAHRLDGGYLKLQFSEALFFRYSDQMHELLSGLHRLGIQLSLSHVGIGWLSPSRLCRLPLKALSLHPALIEAMRDSPADRDIVQALITLAQSLELDITATGVRTTEQRDMLLERGCLRVQGELYADVLSAEQLGRCLLTRPRPREVPERL